MTGDGQAGQGQRSKFPMGIAFDPESGRAEKRAENNRPRRYWGSSRAGQEADRPGASWRSRGRSDPGRGRFGQRTAVDPSPSTRRRPRSGASPSSTRAIGNQSQWRSGAGRGWVGATRMDGTDSQWRWTGPIARGGGWDRFPTAVTRRGSGSTKKIRGQVRPGREPAKQRPGRTGGGDGHGKLGSDTM
jgi:hypothetical protein